MRPILVDYLDADGKLPPAEQILLDACIAGRRAYIESQRPEARTDENYVRAGFLRFLALGGYENVRIDQRGIELDGAWIGGDLDLEGCKLWGRLCLYSCHVDGRLNLIGAELFDLNLDGTIVRGLSADGLQCRGGVFLRFGFCSHGEVRLLGANIGGNLECHGSEFKTEDWRALSCDAAKIGGGVYLAADEHNPFRSTGTVAFNSARIDGNFHCSNAELEATLEGADALSCDGAKIEGNFYFRQIEKIEGNISVAGSSVGTLVDDLESWQKAAHIDIDGFSYAAIAASAPTNALARIQWLEKQRSEYISTQFKPSPWEQIIRILRQSGYDEDARLIAIEKQKRLRQVGKIVGLAGIFHDLFGALVGYGYRPLRLVRAVIAVWLLSSAAFHSAADLGVMAPTNPRIYEDTKYAACRPENLGNWTTCDGPYEYTTFNSILYSLDLILPFVDLQQERDWAPMIMQPCMTLTYFGLCLRSHAEVLVAGEPVALPKAGYWPFGLLVWTMMWLEILFGWIAGLLFVAVISGLIKKD